MTDRWPAATITPTVSLTEPPAHERDSLRGFGFDCLACVAALGFGDIPPQVFSAAFDLLAPGSWIAFNIRQDFLADGHDSGFGDLIDDLAEGGALDLRAQRPYRHRLSTSGDPLTYVAMVARKTAGG